MSRRSMKISITRTGQIAVEMLATMEGILLNQVHPGKKPPLHYSITHETGCFRATTRCSFSPEGTPDCLADPADPDNSNSYQEGYC